MWLSTAQIIQSRLAELKVAAIHFRGKALLLSSKFIVEVTVNTAAALLSNTFVNVGEVFRLREGLGISRFSEFKKFQRISVPLSGKLFHWSQLEIESKI